MKLIALVIKQYDELFKEQIFNFSDEYKVNFNFETNELKIDKNSDYIENFYGESIYNISPIVGINGIGKREEGLDLLFLWLKLRSVWY